MGRRRPDSNRRPPEAHSLLRSGKAMKIRWSTRSDLPSGVGNLRSLLALQLVGRDGFDLGGHPLE